MSIVFTDESLAGQEEAIRALIEDTVRRSEGPLDVGSVRFLVGSDAGRAIPGWGLGGYTLGPDEVEIVVDPSYGNLSTVLGERLPGIVAHELHHTVRWRGPGPYSTLLDALVTEGLADHFAIELLGVPPPPWTMVLSDSQIDLYLERARSSLDDPGFDFEAWFFGIGSDLPRWTGYSLGFHIVGDYLARHPERTAADLVHTPSEAFRPD